MVFTLSIGTGRKAWANSVDPEKMPENEASDQGLEYC